MSGDGVGWGEVGWDGWTGGTGWVGMGWVKMEQDRIDEMGWDVIGQDRKDGMGWNRTRWIGWDG